MLMLLMLLLSDCGLMVVGAFPEYCSTGARKRCAYFTPANRGNGIDTTATRLFGKSLSALDKLYVVGDRKSIMRREKDLHW